MHQSSCNNLYHGYHNNHNLSYTTDKTKISGTSRVRLLYSRRHKNGDISIPSRPVLFKRKRVPVPFNRKTGMERETEQAINGATDYANRRQLKLHARGVQESRKEYYFSQSASCRGDLNRSAIQGRSIDDSENRSQSSGDRKIRSS